MQFPDQRILIFAKAPRPGRVKTRLRPVLDGVAAAALYRELLEGVASRISRGALAPITCWCDPDIDDPCFSELQQRHGIDLERQCGGNLGARMAFAVNRSLAGAGAVILIGGDCPVLGAEHVGEACRRLAEGLDAVLAPAEDGGYVLMGLRRFHPSLFQGVAWGGGEVLQQTRERLQRLGWRWQELETLWDLDRPEDLQRYRALKRR